MWPQLLKRILLLSCDRIIMNSTLSEKLGNDNRSKKINKNWITIGLMLWITILNWNQTINQSNEQTNNNDK